MLIGGKVELADQFINAEQYAQHNPDIADGLDGLAAFLGEFAKQGVSLQYVKVHHLLGQGNFCVTFSEVKLGDADWAIIDLFRLDAGKIVEHWDVMEQIGPKDTWNNSGKF